MVVAALLEEGLLAAAGEGLEANFSRWLRFAGVEHGEWIELQAIKAPAFRGAFRQRFAHADSTASALSLLRQGDAFNAQGVFVIANRVHPAVASRQPPRAWHDAEKGVSTGDRDITHRRVVFIDIDALRTSGTSATDAEMACAVPLAGAIYARLAELLGSANSLGYAHSGNGRQVFIALEVTEESETASTIIKEILAALSVAFKSHGAEVDRTVTDAKRLVPAFGTIKRKGAPDVSDRPHRPTAFVCADEVARLSVEDLSRVLDALIEPLSPDERRGVDSLLGRKSPDPWRDALKAASPTRGDGGTFSRANAIPVADIARELGLFDDGDRVRCPGCSNTGGVALVGNGLKCQHNTCSARGVRGKSGFRTPVDLVAEVRKLDPVDAAKWILARFGGEPPPEAPPRPTSQKRREDVAATEEDEFDVVAPEATLPGAAGAPSAGFIGRDFALTDLGNGERYAWHHRGYVKYLRTWTSWLVWDGTRWATDERGMTEVRAKQTVRAIHAEAARAPSPKKQKALKIHALDSEGANSITSMLKLARSEAGMTAVAADLDLDPWVFNCANGTLDLRTGALRPHTQEDNITKLAPVAYDPEALCPRWDAFLSDIMGGNADLVSFLQRAVGYALTGSVSEQVLFFLHGSGSNGKSTFLRTLLEIFGDYGLQSAPDLLLAKQNDAHPTAMADLHGRRLAVCQEIENGRSLAEATVKQLTGGDIVRARRMRENFWSFVPTHKFFLAANHKPSIRGTDYAIWRRIRLIPFTVTIGEDKKDPHLLEKLLAERAGILRWAVQGCLEWQRLQGLCPPKEVLEATQSYRHEQDVVGEFIDDRCEVGETFTARACDLLEDYRAWCQQNGYRDISAKAFGMQLSTRGFARTKEKHQRCWQGLRLRASEALGKLHLLNSTRAPTETADGPPASFFDDL